jgi:hypothetical protein
MKRLFVLFCLIKTYNLNAQTGIGTSSPINKFQVETTAAAPLSSGTGLNGHIRLGATGANQVLDFGIGTTYGWIQARDKTGYGTNYILALNPNGGNVGINKLAPAKSLDITGDVGISATLTGGNTSTSTISGFAANLYAPTLVSNAYTLQTSDNGKILTFNNATNVTLNVPSLFTGFNCMIIQLGAGQVVFTQSSTTITNRSSFNKTAGTNAIATIVGVTSTSFIVAGDMSN